MFYDAQKLEGKGVPKACAKLEQIFVLGSWKFWSKRKYFLWTDGCDVKTYFEKL